MKQILVIIKNTKMKVNKNITKSMIFMAFVVFSAISFSVVQIF